MVDSLAPLYLLCGAPGAGKTTILPNLVSRAQGLIVADMDELLEDGSLIGVPIATADARKLWPAYDRMWRRIADLVRRSGSPVLLMRPTPSAGDLIAGQNWTEPTFWATLDCSDDERVRRLTARGWGGDAIADALLDAAVARDLLPTVIRSDDTEPSTLTERILTWATPIHRH
ncbi:MAG: hypothetical protein WKF76_02020 [Nocardioidaceae bacterium]